MIKAVRYAPPRSAETSDCQLRSAATGGAVPFARMSRATREPKRKELGVQRDREAHERSRTCDDRHAGDAREARVERESKTMKFNSRTAMSHRSRPEEPPKLNATPG